MSNVALTWAWQQEVGDPTRKLVLVKLADQANDDGVCWPSQRTLAGHVGVTRETINRHIAKLVELGMIRVEERRGEDGRKKSALYHLQVTPTSLGPGDAHVTTHVTPTSQQEPSVEPSVAPSDEGARPLHHRMHEALIEHVLGGQVTPRQIRQTAIAANELVRAGAQPEDIPGAVRKWRSDTTLSSCLVTPMGLANQWSHVAPRRAPPGVQRCEFCAGTLDAHDTDCVRPKEEPDAAIAR